MVRWKSCERPDDAPHFPHGIGTVVDAGPFAVGRAILEPGWCWSTDLKSAVGTELCELHHLHVLVAGRMVFQMSDRQVYEFAPNDVMDIPPGHDAWVVGDEPVILLDTSGNIFPTSASRRRVPEP